MADKKEPPKTPPELVLVHSPDGGKKGLMQVRDKLAPLLPRGMRWEAFQQVALNCLDQVPLLKKCTLFSFLTAVRQIAELGLEPNGALGYAALVPFWNGKRNVYEAKAMPMYKGYVELLYRTGKIAGFWARCVRAQDVFEYEEGIRPILRHIPNFDAGESEETNPIIAVYTIAQFRDHNGGGGALDHHVMSRARIDKVREFSKSSSKADSPWKHWFDEMAMKTCVRRHCKMLPKSRELDGALILDSRLEDPREMKKHGLDMGGFITPEDEEEEQEGAKEDGAEGRQLEEPPPEPMRAPPKRTKKVMERATIAPEPREPGDDADPLGIEEVLEAPPSEPVRKGSGAPETAAAIAIQVEELADELRELGVKDSEQPLAGLPKDLMKASADELRTIRTRLRGKLAGLKE